jgi:hypothetical protein
MTRDPERFVDGGDEGDGDVNALRELLGAARRDLPPADRMEAIFAKLPPVGPVGGGSPGTGAATATAAGKGAVSATSKWAVAVLVGAGAVGTGYVWTRPPEPAARAPVAAVVASATELAPQVASASPTAAASPSPLASAHPTASAEIIPRDRTAPAVASAVRPEIDILKEAQAALGQSPARALTLAAEHERSHPRGALGQERDMLRIQALKAQGKESEARSRAEAFRARYPKSAYLQRLDAMFP